MLILLVVTSDNPEAMADAYGLAAAAVKRGHSVTAFFNDEGVRLLGASERLASLGFMGVRLLACRTSVLECGVESAVAEAHVEMSGLRELVELLEGCDRGVFLG